MQHGDYTHIEVPVDDLERGMRFYREVFGWTFEGNDQMPGYFLYRTPSGEFGGGMGARDTNAPHEIRNYLQVTSVDDTLARVAEFGGTTIEPKTDIPGFGWFAVITDSEGNAFGIFQASMPG
jgi:predicted enzyme related to lactoylglutathione lyase